LGVVVSIIFIPRLSAGTTTIGEHRPSPVAKNVSAEPMAASKWSGWCSPTVSRQISADLAGVGDRDTGFPLPHGRGDEFHHGSPGIDPRSLPSKGPKPRDIYVPDLHIDTIKVKTRDFR
jgi:hypothetical protein